MFILQLFILLHVFCQCFLLFVFLSSEEDFEKLPASTVPEMQRTNLAPVILQLKALGIDNVLRFSFLSVSHSLCSCCLAVMYLSPIKGIVFWNSVGKNTPLLSEKRSLNTFKLSQSISEPLLLKTLKWSVVFLTWLDSELILSFKVKIVFKRHLRLL